MLSCHYGPGGRAATVRRVAARRAGARLAVLLAVLGPVLGSSPARAAVGTAGLLPGQTLLAGQSISDGRDILTMQADGDAVLDAPGNVTLWSTNTSKQTYAVVQLAAHGWGPDQFGCLNSIWVRESGC